MTTNVAAGGPEATFNAMLGAAAGLPGVRIDRATYLRAALGRHCSEEQISKAIDESPAAAGIPLVLIKKIADESINLETTKVTLISAAAGIPGGFAMLGTVPADTLQYFAHMLRIAQKLAYLYSWPDLFDGDDMDDATKGVLTLFVGVMFGVHAANVGLAKVAIKMSNAALIKLPQKALTKGVIYPIVKKVAVAIGEKMTKEIFAKGVSKAIPVVGALLSGGLTLASYLSMCKRLKSHLSRSELLKKDHTDDEAAA